MHGKCPKCDQVVLHVTLSKVEASAPFGETKWHGLAYSCPHCHTILSVGIDPVALKIDTVNETVAQIAKLLRR